MGKRFVDNLKFKIEGKFKIDREYFAKNSGNPESLEKSTK